MLIGIDTSPSVVSLQTEYVQLQNNIKIVRTLRLYKNHFSPVFFSFNPNLGYANQGRLFSSNLPGMFNDFFQGNP